MSSDKISWGSKSIEVISNSRWIRRPANSSPATGICSREHSTSLKPLLSRASKVVSNKLCELKVKFCLWGASWVGDQWPDSNIAKFHPQSNQPHSKNHQHTINLTITQSSILAPIIIDSACSLSFRLQKKKNRLQRLIAYHPTILSAALEICPWKQTWTNWLNHCLTHLIQRSNSPTPRRCFATQVEVAKNRMTR